MTEPTPDHGCTIGGQPAMPILVSEYNHLTARAAELEAILAAVLRLYPAHLNADGPAVRPRYVPAASVIRWRDMLDDVRKAAADTEGS